MVASVNFPKDMAVRLPIMQLPNQEQKVGIYLFDSTTYLWQ